MTMMNTHFVSISSKIRLANQPSCIYRSRITLLVVCYRSMLILVDCDPEKAVASTVKHGEYQHPLSEKRGTYLGILSRSDNKVADRAVQSPARYRMPRNSAIQTYERPIPA